MSLRSLIVILGILLPVACLAGEWHVPGTLLCGDCHLQHGTDPNNPGFSGPFTFLLRKNSVNELCLSCHNGTDATAPDILEPVAMYSTTPARESAGGFFTFTGIDNPNGHTLGLPVSTPLQGVPLSQELNCSSCHAPHGNDNYRNLVYDPAGTGTTINVVAGTHVFAKQRPDVPPTSGGASIAYSRDNIAYATGMATWCISCHDQLSTNGSAASPAHFNAHPSDAALNEFGLSSHVDVAHWTAGTGEGFSTGGGVAGVPRVPFQSPNAADFAAASSAHSANQVSCISCHKAHGSSHQKSMIWPYLDGGDAYLAGCQQCHNK